MFIERPLFFMPWLFADSWWRKDKTEKAVYLTFDDGPVPEVTPKVLAILEQFKVKATFFCVGDNVRKYPDLYRQLIDKGHRVGNHTFNHLKAFSTDSHRYLDNVDAAAQWIDSNLMRPPHGQMTFNIYRALSPKYQIVFWDLITRDYNQSLTPESVWKMVKKKVRSGSIVVFHDSLKAQRNMLYTLPLTIEYLQHEGYKLKTL
ncbi:MAG: polysaccharide deacetylase family protein [Microbacter sp.]